MYKRQAATWGAHEGSLLLWVLLMSGWTFAVAIFSQRIPLDIVARVLAIMGMVSVGFLLFILFTSNPFSRTLPNFPIEGRDLNPLLQDPGLIFHPPLLYICLLYTSKYDKEGEFTPITWDQAFDVMEEKFKTALKEKGPESIGMFGSGQWTIWEGYAASKLFKAGFRSNNIDPNARHCMASAVVGFMRTFGMDEPMGCYDDIEQADAFVLWGANMAEMHPILWSRITNRRLSNQNVTVAVLSTYQHRSFELADNGIIFTPQSDLVILNYIANYIIQNNAINQDFFSKHVNLRKGATDIGYGLRCV